MPDELAGRLRKLQDLLDDEVIDADAYEAGLAKLRAQHGADAVDALLRQGVAPPAPRSHSLTAGDNAHIGVAVAGDVHGSIFHGGKQGKAPDELIRRYLDDLARTCGMLSLQGIKEQKNATDVLAINLEQVYTQLATTELVERETLDADARQQFDLQEFFQHYVGAALLPRDQRRAVRVQQPATDEVRRGTGQEPLPNRLGERWLLLDLQHRSSDEIEQQIAEADRLVFLGPQLVTEAIAANDRLVLLGEPGSGKSTVLRYLALTLAQAALNPARDLAERLAGWPHHGAKPPLLPLLMPLLPLAQRVAVQPKRAGTAEDLWNQLAEHLEPHGANEGLATTFYEALAKGRVLLLLDGLDEVANADARRQVTQAVTDFAAKHSACRIVVTCRVRAYTGERNHTWQLGGWPSATLADWTLGQMTTFTDAWYRAAVAAGGLPEVKREARVAALQRAITTRPDLQRLGVSPLLLTIMALVHLNDGRLPEDRVTLYNRCIDILLAQWEVAGRPQSEYGALTDFIGLPDTDVKSLRPLLTQAAYQAHSAGVPGSLGQLSRDALELLVIRALAERKHPNPYEGAQKFLAYTDVRTGLLHASDAGDAYVFPHQTFQEYLAGLELVGEVDFVERIMARRNEDHWHVPILLGIGHLVSENALAMPHQLLTELLAGDERAQAQAHRDALLAAEIAADVGWDRLERGGSSFKKLRRDLSRALAGVVEGSALPAAERVQAGVYLGHLGDLRPGVCDLPPAMVAFAGGTFLIGEPKKVATYDNQINDRPMTVVPFELARYPVTNAQFACFIDADGYQPAQPWWDTADQQWLRSNSRTQPSRWDDERFGQSRPNHPVVGVTWYEAMAFCCWLTQTLNDGFVYTLPSEAEWEYAARGTVRRIYPWGDVEPDAERANFNQIYGGTTAVGCFGAEATPEGILDLAGNVWEWTRSAYRDYPYDPEDGREILDEPADKQFTLRGGGWNYLPLGLRASGRDYGTPDLHLIVIGFRLARHPPV